MYLLSFIAFFLLRFFVFGDLKLDGFPFIKFIRRCISLRDGGERLADASTEPSTILNLSGLYVLASSRKPSLNILINAKFKISSFGSFLFILGRDRRRCRDAGFFCRWSRARAFRGIVRIVALIACISASDRNCVSFVFFGVPSPLLVYVCGAYLATAEANPCPIARFYFIRWISRWRRWLPTSIFPGHAMHGCVQERWAVMQRRQSPRPLSSIFVGELPVSRRCITSSFFI